MAKAERSPLTPEETRVLRKVRKLLNPRSAPELRQEMDALNRRIQQIARLLQAEREDLRHREEQLQVLRGEWADLYARLHQQEETP